MPSAEEALESLLKAFDQIRPYRSGRESTIRTLGAGSGSRSGPLVGTVDLDRRGVGGGAKSLSSLDNSPLLIAAMPPRRSPSSGLTRRNS